MSSVEKRKMIRIFLLCIIILSINISPAYADNGNPVYRLQVEGIIDGGMVAYFQRAYQMAEEEDARAVILEIDTPGGLIDAAIDIRKIIKDSPVNTIAYVRGGAISAGVLVALSSQEIYMAPGTTIGDAEPRIGGKKADEKTASYWSSLLATSAEENDRDGRIARAMADRDISVEGLKEKGKLLTLTDQEAFKWGFSEGGASNIRMLMGQLGVKDKNLKSVSMNLTEHITRYITNPYITPVLLTIGFAGLAVELLTVGFGAAGLLSFSAFILFFWGHFFAGLSGWGVILLFVGGVFLIILEAFVIPGFGAAGIGGIAALLLSVILAVGSVKQGIISLSLALLGTSLAIYLSFKFGHTRRLWERLILNVKLDRESGYLPSDSPRDELVGKEGVTITPLRPAGAVQINGQRLDVVTEGGFIPRGKMVQVVKVEDNRIVVKKAKQ